MDYQHDWKKLPYQGTVVLVHGFVRDLRPVLTCTIPDEVLDICASFRGMPFREVPDVYEYFEIEGELGRGASCRVLKVRNKKTNELSAMKEIRRDAKWSPMIFEQECRILQTLGEHKNIMDFKDCWVDRENFYIISAVCTGGELFGAYSHCIHSIYCSACTLKHLFNFEPNLPLILQCIETKR